MARLLKGAPVSAEIDEETRKAASKCSDADRIPRLVTIRVGSDPSDIAYERSLSKKAQSVGVDHVAKALDADAGQHEVEELLISSNADPDCSGIMVFRPLPKHLDEMAICDLIAPEKDVDGVGARSLASVFMGASGGFAPATARACIDICDHYGIVLEGKHVVVVGRSLVVGKPVAMLALGRNATVTLAHSRTGDLPGLTSKADVVIAAIGKPMFFGAEHLSEGQVVIDVGINVDGGGICGDVDSEQAAGIVSDLTPVPGGVGAVATSALLNNVAISCLASIGAK